jgi:hypothetical protein
MDKYGFVIYENALNFQQSSSLEEVDDDLRIGWGSNYNYTLYKDNIYLSSYNSYSDFNNNKNNKLYNITKTNKIVFLKIIPKQGTSYFFNEMFKEYGIIGLKFNSNQNFNAPEFIISLKEIKEIQTYTFSLLFENKLKNGFIDNNNKGYFIVGEELTDSAEEKEEIKYVQCETIGGELSWDLKFDSIHTRKKDENQKTPTEYNEKIKTVEIIANYPYIIGTSEYFKYLNETFFNTAINNNFCFVSQFKKHGLFLYDYYSFVCDGKSKDFMNFLNNNFPELIFELKELEMNFTLTKKDLFTYNSFNDSDENLYFLVINCMEKTYDNWYLGIPFLKKYRLSFNYDTKMIGFYKNDGIEKEERNNGDKGYNFFESIFFKIILIIILILIIFILGMLFQKHFQKSRKKKANELDDNYEYESYKETKNNNDDNDNIINNDNDNIN